MDNFKDFITNKYTRYFILSFFVGVLVYLILWMLSPYVELFTPTIRLMLSVLIAGYLVYRYIFARLG